MTDLLKDKNVLITGASSGIGKALAIGFAKMGANIIILDLNVENGQITKEAVESNGQKAWVIQCNVQQYDSVKSAVDKAIENAGKIDMLINNAGYSKLKLIKVLKVGEFSDILNTNVLGVYNMTHAVVPHMIENKGGIIVTTGSLASKMAMAKYSAYGMSKAAILGFTSNLGVELKRDKITVNAIHPNMVDTPLLRQGLTQEDLDRLKPMQPEELIPYYAFFATKQGSRMTGVNVDVEIVKAAIALKSELPEEKLNEGNITWRDLSDIAKEKMKSADYKDASQARGLISFLLSYISE